MVAAELWMASGETADLGAGMASDRFDELLRYGAMASAPIPVDPMEVAFHEDAVSAACQDVRGWTLINTNTLRPDLWAWTTICTRTNCAQGTGVPVRVDFGGRRFI